jgi:hypothetical protein
MEMLAQDQLCSCTLSETGTFISPVHNRGGCNVQNEEEASDAAHANRSISACWVAYETALSQSVVWLALYEEQLYPFHVQVVQALQPMDKNVCLQFCQWLLYKTINEPDFLCLRWTDDATFTSSGVKVYITYMNRHWRILMLLTALHFKKI